MVVEEEFEGQEQTQEEAPQPQTIDMTAQFAELQKNLVEATREALRQNNAQIDERFAQLEGSLSQPAEPQEPAAPDYDIIEFDDDELMTPAQKANFTKMAKMINDGTKTQDEIMKTLRALQEREAYRYQQDQAAAAKQFEDQLVSYCKEKLPEHEAFKGQEFFHDHIIHGPKGIAAIMAAHPDRDTRDWKSIADEAMDKLGNDFTGVSSKQAEAQAKVQVPAGPVPTGGGSSTVASGKAPEKAKPFDFNNHAERKAAISQSVKDYLPDEMQASS